MVIIVAMFSLDWWLGGQVWKW